MPLLPHGPQPGAPNPGGRAPPLARPIKGEAANDLAGEQWPSRASGRESPPRAICRCGKSRGGRRCAGRRALVIYVVRKEKPLGPLGLPAALGWIWGPPSPRSLPRLRRRAECLALSLPWLASRSEDRLPLPDGSFHLRRGDKGSSPQGCDNRPRVTAIKHTNPQKRTPEPPRSHSSPTEPRARL